jgi:hypothetical protein
MMLTGVDEAASAALVNKFKVDTLPELQEKVMSNTSLLESTLIPFLDQPKRIEMVSRSFVRPNTNSSLSSNLYLEAYL